MGIPDKGKSLPDKWLKLRELGIHEQRFEHIEREKEIKLRAAKGDLNGDEEWEAMNYDKPAKIESHVWTKMKPDEIMD